MENDYSVWLPTRNPDVLFKRVGDGAVLLSIVDEVYFGLDPVGARIWELLPPQSDSLAEVCAAIGRDYQDATPEAIDADVRELLDDLLSTGLVIRKNGVHSS